MASIGHKLQGTGSLKSDSSGLILHLVDEKAGVLDVVKIVKFSFISVAFGVNKLSSHNR